MDSIIVLRKGNSVAQKKYLKENIIDPISKIVGIPICWAGKECKEKIGRTIGQRYSGETIYGESNEVVGVGLRYNCRIYGYDNDVFRIQILMHELGHCFLHPNYETGLTIEEEEAQAELFAYLTILKFFGVEYVSPYYLEKHMQYLNTSMYKEVSTINKDFCRMISPVLGRNKLMLCDKTGLMNIA